MSLNRRPRAFQMFGKRSLVLHYDSVTFERCLEDAPKHYEELSRWFNNIDLIFWTKQVSVPNGSPTSISMLGTTVLNQDTAVENRLVRKRSASLVHFWQKDAVNTTNRTQ